jgi:hypothetical protein
LSEPGTAEESAEQRFRRAVLEEVVNNVRIERLIPRKPVLGGTWRVASPKDVEFLGNGQVALDYEDGHLTGRLIVKVVEPNDLSTWKVVRHEAESSESTDS